MEIVSEPDIASPEEAFAYLTSLQQILIYGGVSDADMEKGQLRCDCNVSVRPEGQKELGVKIEIKNMNSISAVRRALAYEIERQTAALERGETLVQSTRGWDDAAGQTRHQRTKESSHDYRYFPDPDLMPVRTAVFMDEVRARRPELPGEKRDRFVSQYGITPYDASVLASEKALAGYFEDAARNAADAKAVANFVINDLLSALGAAERSIADCPVPAAHLGDLVNIVKSGAISSKQAKEVFAEMFASGKAPAAIVEEKGLKQESDTGAIEALCQQAIDANPKPAAEFRAGNEKSINFLKGQVMKLSQGKANPQIVNEVLVKLLSA
jgi:aspartyl-tRNA(Asn)/glutamyl-tRNA(Gln) amidotransferase subunit B